jgi:hypothetical protein
MAKAALAGASNYVEAASDYLHESRTGEERSRGVSDDDSPGSRGLPRKLAEPQEKLNLLPQWAVCVPRKNKAGEVIQHESGQLLADIRAIRVMLNTEDWQTCVFRHA